MGAQGPKSARNKVAPGNERVKKVAVDKQGSVEEQDEPLEEHEVHQGRRVHAESLPPALVAEVFDVAGADDDVILSSVPYQLFR